MTEWLSLFTKLTSLYGQVSVNMKIVSLKKTGNLPSFHILSRKDIKAALDFAEHHINHANEIWWRLLSTAETEEEAYSGRVTFHHNKLAPQILEVVWDKDTRAIDKYYKQKNHINL